MFANNGNLFSKPELKQAEEDDNDDDGEPLVDKDEVPMYANESGKVTFKEGVKIEKNPYIKIFDVSWFAKFCRNE